MKHDEVIQETWRIKEEIAAQYHYDVHEYVKALREKRGHDATPNTSKVLSAKGRGVVHASPRMP